MSLKILDTSGNLLYPSAPLATAEQLVAQAELFGNDPRGVCSFKKYLETCRMLNRRRGL